VAIALIKQDGLGALAALRAQLADEQASSEALQAALDSLHGDQA
jgi:hypothetical protein